MSDPKDPPAERPKLWERRDDKPVDPPAEEPTPTDGPKNKPDLLPRDPDNPTPDPDPDPTPKVPTDLPKIATERLMDVDVDGDGIPDHVGGRDPILGDGDDLGDIVTGGPPVGRTASADSSQSAGDIAAPPSGDSMLEIQVGRALMDDIVGIRKDSGEAVVDRDGPAVRKDSGEAHLADRADEVPGDVVPGGSTMLDASTPKRADFMDASSPYLHDAASPTELTYTDASSPYLSEAAPQDDPGDLVAQIGDPVGQVQSDDPDSLADQPEGDSALTAYLE